MDHLSERAFAQAEQPHVVGDGGDIGGARLVEQERGLADGIAGGEHADDCAIFGAGFEDALEDNADVAGGATGFQDHVALLAFDGGAAHDTSGGGGVRCGGVRGWPCLAVAARTLRPDESLRVSTITAAAADVDGTVVAVQLEDGDVVFYVDNEPVDLARGETLALDGGGGVVNTGAAYVVVWADRTTAWINVTAPDVLLDVFFSASVSAEDWQGLLGDLDGNPSNDLRTRAGETISPDAGFGQIHGVFSDSWRISNEESLFHYDDCETTETFNITGFPSGPVTLSGLDSAKRVEAEIFCQGAEITDQHSFANCVLDVATTGDPVFALSAAYAQIAWGAPASPLAAVPDLVWTSELTGYQPSGGTEALIDRNGRLLVRARHETGRTDLLALDAATGEIEETWQDLSATCAPGLDGDGRIWAQRRTPTGGAEVIVIDPETDAVIATYDPSGADDVAPCDGSIHLLGADSVVFVHNANFVTTIESLRVDDDGIRSLWRAPVEGASAPQLVVGENASAVYLLQVRSASGGEAVVLSKFGVDDGSLVDEVVIAELGADGTAQSSDVTMDSQGFVYVSYPNQGNDHRYATVVQIIDTGALTEGWRTGDDTASRDWTWDLHVFGDLIVSWDGSTDRLVAIDKSSGDFAWAYEAESFSNSSSIGSDTDGNLYFAPFVGFLESVDLSGERRWYLSSEDSGFGTVSALGPVSRSQLYVMHAVNDTPVWVAFDIAP